MFKKKSKTKQNKTTGKKRKKHSPPERKSNPGLLTCEVNALSIAPRQLMFQLQAF